MVIIHYNDYEKVCLRIQPGVIFYEWLRNYQLKFSNICSCRKNTYTTLPNIYTNNTFQLLNNFFFNSITVLRIIGFYKINPSIFSALCMFKYRTKFLNLFYVLFIEESLRKNVLSCRKQLINFKKNILLKVIKLLWRILN